MLLHLEKDAAFVDHVLDFVSSILSLLQTLESANGRLEFVFLIEDRRFKLCHLRFKLRCLTYQPVADFYGLIHPPHFEQALS